MPLKVVGPGFGRTGTKSLKEALEILGFGPCHHMYEVLDHLEQVPTWQALAKGEARDWEAVFAGYGSQVDWPGAHYWRELAEAFPDAKVLHSVRPEASWVKSFSRTIGKLLTVYQQMDFPPHIRDILDMNIDIVGNATFGGNWTDPDVLLAAYRKRTDDVVQAIDPDRLLVFDVAQGWEPLCKFLDVPVPDGPFPHHNLQADFWEVLGGEPD